LREWRRRIPRDASPIALTPAERTRVVAAVTEQLKEELGDTAIATIEERFRDQLSKSTQWKELRTLAERTRVRLLTEIAALSKRSNLNLVIGILTTGAAISLLAYIVLSTEVVVPDWRALIPGYVLRLSLVAFIEVFAFFFLRMYRANLYDIKYFQNELTNVEVQCLALEAALQHADVDAIRGVLGQLGTTERNSILRKGETTVEVSRTFTA
jgi:hypothetical protein